MSPQKLEIYRKFNEYLDRAKQLGFSDPELDGIRQHMETFLGSENYDHRHEALQGLQALIGTGEQRPERQHLINFIQTQETAFRMEQLNERLNLANTRPLEL